MNLETPNKPAPPEISHVREKKVEEIDLTEEAIPIEEGEEFVDLTAEAVSEEREPGELQEKDVIDAFEINGFKGLQVAATLEKYKKNQGTAERNQDNILADPKTGLLGVMDGLGSTQGDLASKSAERAIPEHYQNALKEAPKDASEIVNRIVEQQLNKIASEDPKRKTEQRIQLTQMVEGMLTKDPNMGRKAYALIEGLKRTNASVKETGAQTTACIGFVHAAPDGTKWAVIGSVGDSIAFKRRKNGELIQLNKEDSLLNNLVDKGIVSPEQLKAMQSNPKEKNQFKTTLDIVKAMGGGEAQYQAMLSRGMNTLDLSYRDLKRAMLSALGSEVFEPTLTIRRLDPGDELLFATDGLTDKYETDSGEVDLKAIAAEFESGKSLKENINQVRTAAKFIESAAKADDDIALVSARVE